MQIENKTKLKNYFWKQGYVIFNIENDELIDKVCKDVRKIIKKKNLKQILKYIPIINLQELLKVTNTQIIAKNYPNYLK